MASDGRSEKDISLSVVFENQTSQTKNNSENPPLLQSHTLSALNQTRKSKNRADVSDTSFAESYIKVNTYLNY